MNPSPAIRDDESGYEPAFRVIGRVVTELEAISRAIDENQSKIAGAIAEPGFSLADVARLMQQADLLSQKVAGVAGFLHHIAASVPREWEVDAAGATDVLTLDELVRKIGRGGHLLAETEIAAHGHIDLF